MSDTGNDEGGGRKRGGGPKGPRIGRPSGGGRDGSGRGGAGKPSRPRDGGGRSEGRRGEGEDARRDARPKRPFVKREAGGEGEGRKPFRRGAEGEGRPFTRREDRPRDEGRSDRPRGEGGSERPARSFEKKPFRPREEGGGEAGEGRARPQRSDRPQGGERKPFRPFSKDRFERGDGERPRPFRREAREDAGKGEGRPFRKPFGKDAGEGGFKPRSRGMFSHGGSSEGGEERRPRSYGRLSHEGEVRRERNEDAGGERRPPRRDEGGFSTERKRPARESAERTLRAPREDAAAPSGRMRIAKRLARAGISSRRDAEGMIADGRVKVNGVRLESPAMDVSVSDRIEIDGQPIPAIERTRLWLFHKPAGLVTTNRDPEGRPTVFDRLPEDMPRVLSIGRLDINTEGLLLLTNDGGLARVLELPSTGWLRRYRVRAHGEISQEKLDELRQGIAVDGVFYGAIEATLDRSQGSNVWLTLGLREGKNREVKRVLGHLGLEVNRLIRISFGPFQLGELEEGAVQEIKGRTLRDQLGERLIEEAGADFDAPIVNPFSNRPVEGERAPRGAPGSERPKKRGDWISASETKPNRKKFGAAKREDALDRLDTRPPRRSERGEGEERRLRPDRDRDEKKPFGERKPRAFGKDRPGEADGDKRPTRRPPAAPKRTTNVWMAPGSKALGEKKRAERDERDRNREEGSERRGPPRGRPAGPAGKSPRGDGPARPPRRPKV